MAKIATALKNSSSTKNIQRPQSSGEIQQIEKLAYQFFVDRGYQHGCDQEDWARAAQVLTRVVELKPTQAINHFVLATCLDKLGNVSDALLHYNKFLEYDDGSSDARSFQARQRARILEGRLKRK